MKMTKKNQKNIKIYYQWSCICKKIIKNFKKTTYGI